MSFPKWLLDVAYEKLRGFRDYRWYVSATVPANTTVPVTMTVPYEHVWFERGYKIEVSKLDVFVLSHYHDGLPQFVDIVIGESELELPYSKWETVEYLSTIIIRNSDSASQSIKVSALYRVCPRLLWEWAKMKVLRIRG